MVLHLRAHLRRLAEPVVIPEIIITAVVFFIGVPAMWKNPTATALVASWSLGQAVWMISGDNLPLRIYFMIDILVVGAIFCKKDVAGSWLERSVCDRIVLAIFPIMWLLYILNISESFKWWALWGLALVQFLAAGAEALLNLRAQRAEKKVVKLPFSSLRLGLAGHV